MASLDPIFFHALPGTLNEISIRVKRDKSNTLRKLRRLQERGLVTKQGNTWEWCGEPPVGHVKDEDIHTNDYIELERWRTFYDFVNKLALSVGFKDEDLPENQRKEFILSNAVTFLQVLMYVMKETVRNETVT